MRKVSGLLYGIGTDPMFIGLGFCPDEVHMQALTGTTMGVMKWNRHFIRNNVMPEGVQTSTNTRGALADGAGIQLYYGGDILSAADTSYVVPITHPFFADTYGRDQRYHATNATTATRLLVTTDAATKCHFDKALDTTYFGVGSRIIVKPDTGGPLQEFACVALTGDGDTVDDVTLNNAVTAGDLMFVSYKYDFAPLPVGYVMPMGIKINETTLWNSSGVLTAIEAVQW